MVSGMTRPTSNFLLRNVRMVEPGRRIVAGDLLVRDGAVAERGQISLVAGESMVAIDGEGRLLTPGLIDMHTHGVGHSLYETGGGGLRGAASQLGRFGVTTVLPTFIPHPDKPASLNCLADLAAAIDGIREVNVPGLHLEGPFMAVGGAACPTMPGDCALLDELLSYCAGRVAIMSVSPETPGILPVIKALRQRDIRVFLTHTRATVEQTEAALAAGACHATHFYDVFYAPPESDPGVRPVGAVEAILADTRTSVDFIADGVHVHPTAIRAAVAAKGWSGVILITDSNIGAGLPAGVYPTKWGFSVRVSPEAGARHATENTLAGSALTMDRGMANLLRWLDLPPEQIWAMGTLNPARILGLAGKGHLDTGADADLVLWDEDLTAAMTWTGGTLVYEKK
jgi:N-acetylglucosamine-6-phosphate deacetylase